MRPPTIDGMHRLDGRRVVVQMGFTPRQCGHVDTEAKALRAMPGLQGVNVRLLAHGLTHEGFAYVITEYIDVSSVACPSGSSGLGTSFSCSHVSPKRSTLVIIEHPKAAIRSGH